MKTSRVAAIATAVALAFTLGACSTPAATTTSTKASVDPASLKASLTWWDTSDATNEAPAFKSLIADFNKVYPNVTIDYQTVPFSDAQNKFKTAAAAKSGAPDILRADVGWVAEFASLGYLYALDGTDLTADKTDYLATPLASTTYNGKSYGVPQVTDSLGLFYNKKMFAAAGITAAPKTWDELKSAAATIKEKTGKDGVALNPAGYFMLPFIYGEGGDMVDAKAKSITIGNAAAVKGATTIQSLLASPGFTKPAATDAYSSIMTAFKAGNVAMVVQGPWELANMKKATDFGGLDNLGIAPVPAGSVKAGAPVGGHDYVIYSGMDANKAQAAIAFVKFMSSVDSQVKLADSLGLLPTRTAAYTKVTNPVIAAFQPVMASAVPRPWIPEGGKLFSPLDDAATAIYVQGGDAKAALTKVANVYKTEVVKDYALA